MKIVLDLDTKAFVGMLDEKNGVTEKFIAPHGEVLYRTKKSCWVWEGEVIGHGTHFAFCDFQAAEFLLENGFENDERVKDMLEEFIL